MNTTSNFNYLTSGNSTLNEGISIPFNSICYVKESKCKCPNPKHTQGCSIEPTGEYCEWCSKGCRKRVMAVHVSYK